MKNSKIALFVVLGIVFWFNAAMIVRFLGDSCLTENNPKLILMFLLAFPVTAISFYFTKVISKLDYSELLRPVVIMTLTATFCDGIALTWFRQLYSKSFEVALHGAALILWAVGLGLLFAYILENRKIER
jgi:Family of unknown function (DUF5367)